jgi:hypothetical protein
MARNLLSVFAVSSSMKLQITAVVLLLGGVVGIFWLMRQ